MKFSGWTKKRFSKKNGFNSHWDHKLNFTSNSIEIVNLFKLLLKKIVEYY